MSNLAKGIYDSIVNSKYNNIIINWITETNLKLNTYELMNGINELVSFGLLKRVDCEEWMYEVC